MARFVRNNAVPIALVLSLAFLSAELSVRLRADTFAERFASELATLHGQASRFEFQNRILAPGLLLFFREIFPPGVADRSVWFASRVVEASMAYVVLYAVAFRLTGGRLRALLAVALVAYAYVWTPMSHAWEYTNDFLDILFTATFVGLALAGQRILLGIMAALAAMNRESAAFAGVIWMALAALRYRPWREHWRKFVPGVVYMALAGAIVAGLRYGLGHGLRPQQQLGAVETFMEWRWIVYPDGAFPMLVAMVLAFAVVLRGLPRPWTIDQKGLLAGASACAVITLVFGIAGELRVWLPCCVILSLLAVAGANGQSDRQWMLSLFGERK